jgi:hypothetical protein
MTGRDTKPPQGKIRKCGECKNLAIPWEFVNEKLMRRRVGKPVKQVRLSEKTTRGCWCNICVPEMSAIGRKGPSNTAEAWA